MPTIATAAALTLALAAAPAAPGADPAVERLVARIEASPAGCGPADAASPQHRTIEADVALFRQRVPESAGVAIDVLDCYWDGMVDRGERIVVSARLARATPAQRFFVIAHEFGHFVLRHHASFARFAAALLAAGNEGSARTAIDAGAAAPLSRDHEAAADAHAVTLMLRAGLDPEEAARFWDRIGQGAVQASRTHPAPSARAQAIRAMAAQARPVATTQP